MSSKIQALQEEVSFWQHMVNEYQDRQDLPEYRKIREALVVAEFKLEKRLQQEIGGANPGS